MSNNHKKKYNLKKEFGKQIKGGFNFQSRKDYYDTDREINQALRKIEIEETYDRINEIEKELKDLTAKQDNRFREKELNRSELEADRDRLLKKARKQIKKYDKIENNKYTARYVVSMTKHFTIDQAKYAGGVSIDAAKRVGKAAFNKRSKKRKNDKSKNRIKKLTRQQAFKQYVQRNPDGNIIVDKQGKKIYGVNVKDFNKYYENRLRENKLVRQKRRKKNLEKAGKKILESKKFNFFIPYNSTKGIIEDAVLTFRAVKSFKANNLVKDIKNSSPVRTATAVVSGINSFIRADDKSKRIKNATRNLANGLINNYVKQPINSIKDAIGGVKELAIDGANYLKTNCWDRPKEYVVNAANKVKNIYNKGKSAAKFVFGGGLKNAINDARDNITKKVDKFTNGVNSAINITVNNPKEALKYAAGAVGRKISQIGKNGLNALKRAAKDTIDSIVNWLVEHKEMIINTAKFAAGLGVIWVLVFAVMSIVGILSVLGRTPHYYCDTGTNVPSLLKSGAYWKQYCSVGRVNDFVYWQQNGEHEWSGIAYGTGTISTDGCGPTCFAMAASTFSEQLFLNPGEILDEYTSMGGEGEFSEFNMTYQKGIEITTGSEQEIKQYLDDGCFVQVCMGVRADTIDESPANHTSAHYILITGYDDNGFYIGDPYVPEKTAIESTPGEGMHTEGLKEEPFDFQTLLHDVKGNLGGDSRDNKLYCPITKK